VDEFLSFSAMGSKEAKQGHAKDAKTIFHLFSNGVKTNRDEIVHDFTRDKLEDRIKQFIEAYNSEVDRYLRKKKEIADEDEKLEEFNIDDFVHYDKISWSESLKKCLENNLSLKLAKDDLRSSLYRPFVTMNLYFNEMLVERRYKFQFIFPTVSTEKNNRVICVPGLGGTKTYCAFIVAKIPCQGLITPTQCFPFYTYDEDGTNQHENITDWALKKYQTKYADKKITKWDIFYYIYGVLHHPGYHLKYADNLRRDLPRIPFAPDFWAFSKAGQNLAKWHLEYESIKPYKLTFETSKDIPLSYRVDDKMRLSRDKSEIRVNSSLTLTGIPPEAFEYQLGNRSALEWVLEYYKVKKFKPSGIVWDPNNDDDPEYIVRLVGQVVKVSLETVKIVKSLPTDFGG
jgi:predicted helicase